MSNYRIWILVLLLAGLPAGRAGAAERTEPLLGGDIPPIALASAGGDLVEYTTDFYGRHALVLTFFPAAFTPV